MTCAERISTDTTSPHTARLLSSFRERNKTNRQIDMRLCARKLIVVDRINGRYFAVKGLVWRVGAE